MPGEATCPALPSPVLPRPPGARIPPPARSVPRRRLSELDQLDVIHVDVIGAVARSELRMEPELQVPPRDADGRRLDEGPAPVRPQIGIDRRAAAAGLRLEPRDVEAAPLPDPGPDLVIPC